MSRYKVVPREYWSEPSVFSLHLEIADLHNSSRGLSEDDVATVLRNTPPCVPCKAEDDGSVLFPLTEEGLQLATLLCQQLNETATNKPSPESVRRGWV